MIGRWGRWQRARDRVSTQASAALLRGTGVSGWRRAQRWWHAVSGSAPRGRQRTRSRRDVCLAETAFARSFVQATVAQVLAQKQGNSGKVFSGWKYERTPEKSTRDFPNSCEFGYGASNSATRRRSTFGRTGGRFPPRRVNSLASDATVSAVGGTGFASVFPFVARISN
jgi:hypothetical protein